MFLSASESDNIGMNGNGNLPCCFCSDGQVIIPFANLILSCFGISLYVSSTIMRKIDTLPLSRRFVGLRGYVLLHFVITIFTPSTIRTQCKAECELLHVGLHSYWFYGPSMRGLYLSNSKPINHVSSILWCKGITYSRMTVVLILFLGICLISID